VIETGIDVTLLDLDHVHDAAAKDDTDEADAEVFRALYAGIEKALKELDRQGHIEINANARQDLTEEIVTVMTAARPLERAIRAAVETLVESPHVAEVYGDGRGGHAWNVALRATLVPERVYLDGSYGRQTGSVGARLVTVGFKVTF
jgi:plasmid stabilization system protein ParE